MVNGRLFGYLLTFLASTMTADIAAAANSDDGSDPFGEHSTAKAERQAISNNADAQVVGGLVTKDPFPAAAPEATSEPRSGDDQWAEAATATSPQDLARAMQQVSMASDLPPDRQAGQAPARRHERQRTLARDTRGAPVRAMPAEPSQALAATMPAAAPMARAQSAATTAVRHGVAGRNGTRSIYFGTAAIASGQDPTRGQVLMNMAPPSFSISWETCVLLSIAAIGVAGAYLWPFRDGAGHRDEDHGL